MNGKTPTPQRAGVLRSLSRTTQEAQEGLAPVFLNAQAESRDIDELLRSTKLERVACSATAAKQTKNTESPPALRISTRLSQPVCDPGLRRPGPQGRKRKAA
jgi:hypothetical protein